MKHPLSSAEHHIHTGVGVHKALANIIPPLPARAAAYSLNHATFNALIVFWQPRRYVLSPLFLRMSIGGCGLSAWLKLPRVEIVPNAEKDEYFTLRVALAGLLDAANDGFTLFNAPPPPPPPLDITKRLAVTEGKLEALNRRAAEIAAAESELEAREAKFEAQLLQADRSRGGIGLADATSASDIDCPGQNDPGCTASAAELVPAHAATLRARHLQHSKEPSASSSAVDAPHCVDGDELITDGQSRLSRELTAISSCVVDVESQDDKPITFTAFHRIRWERTDEYRQWQQDTIDIISKFPGFISAYVMPPQSLDGDAHLSTVFGVLTGVPYTSEVVQ